jgi:5-methylcytosine-specific restriction endonuclease McrA
MEKEIKMKTCPSCEKEFQTRNSRKIYCSRRCHAEYMKKNKNTPDCLFSWGKIRWSILVRDKFKCQYCGRKVIDNIVLHVDHLIPVSKGGTNNPNNLITSCSECNQGKGADVLPPGLLKEIPHISIEE